MRNNRRNNAVAQAVDNRSGIARRMTLLALMAAAAVAAAALIVRPAGAEPVASGFVYTADEHGGSISRTDLSTGKVDSFPVAITPHDAARRGKVVKTIRTGLGAHGVAVSNDGAFVLVTNIVDGTVSLISVKDQSVLKSYAVGKGPNGITFQSASPASGDAG